MLQQVGSHQLLGIPNVLVVVVLWWWLVVACGWLGQLPGAPEMREPAAANTECCQSLLTFEFGFGKHDASRHKSRGE